MATSRYSAVVFETHRLPQETFSNAKDSTIDTAIFE
jgi:hypothetical protein